MTLDCFKRFIADVVFDAAGKGDAVALQILRENAAKQVDSDEDLMAFRNKLKERKGTNG